MASALANGCAVVACGTVGAATGGSGVVIRSSWLPSSGAGCAGGPWLPEPQRQAIRDVCSHTINRAVDLIGDKTAPALARIKAMELILNYAYGMPGIATIVKYEVELIIKEYGLPPRHKLVDRHGNRLFKSHGQYKPSADFRSSLKRHQFIERMEQAYLRDDEEVEADAGSKLHPTLTTYEPPLRPKSEALKRLTAEQERVDHMKSEIRQAVHDLQEMKDIYEEANKTLTAYATSLHGHAARSSKVIVCLNSMCCRHMPREHTTLRISLDQCVKHNGPELYARASRMDTTVYHPSEYRSEFRV
jgi:hypothetical protein